MNVYPALQGRMGRWQYYNVKMTMRELADNVKFAADIHDDRTLDEAIQRVLQKSRAQKDIVGYLIGQPDRFFASIVVAALRGNPKWYPVTMEDDERFALFRDDARINDTFGILSFDGTQDYFALDGQHRLAAIKALVDPNSDVSPDAPLGFKDEEISVIVVVPSGAESAEEFRTRYRRLFGNLNRYAKPTDAVTNIIMDEDDAFAIITRRLITEHKFFQFSGRQKESPRVKTEKGKNLRSTDPFFTSLEALYAINMTLLTTPSRANSGWDKEKSNSRDFQRFRPNDEILDGLTEELFLYWDALLEELPELREPPENMRDHSAPEGDGSTQDNFLFWPIGQELLAEVARGLMNARQQDPATPTKESVQESLQGLCLLNWNAHQAPWRNLVLIPESAKRSWSIRSEERKRVLTIVRRIFRWQLGHDELGSEEVDKLREEWQGLLLPALDDSKVNELWTEITDHLQR